MMVGLVKDYLGRGPTKARTIHKDNVAICLMRGTLTRAEQSLVADDKAGYVREMRRTFQDTMEDDAKGRMEKLTGRKVISFMSDHDVKRDLAVEIFVLDGDRPADVVVGADPR
jgi:uncharacterized protein YbcI